jgi:perosamine synthetase
MQIKYPFSKPKFFGDEKDFVQIAIESTWISGGEYIEKFEDWFSNLYDDYSAIATSNGTSALQLAYLALGLEAGDEIIVPAYGFMAAANVAMQMGIKPVFVDIERDGFNIDAEQIPYVITKKTKAIVAIHTYGYVADLKGLLNVSSKYNLPLIEDCAEACGSWAWDSFCGTYGDIATFSFHASKNITTGEGGMLLTSNNRYYRRARLYHSHGLKERGTYDHIVPGNNFRMSNIHAAIGFGQMSHFHDVITKRQQIMEWYKFHLGKFYVTPTPQFGAVLWAYPILVDERHRDEKRKILLASGIETRPGFVPAHKLSYFNTGYNVMAQHYADKTILLPLYYDMEENDVEYIVDVLMTGEY